MIGKAAAGIEDLRRERGAVILAHSYQPPDIQALADHVGDSLELSRRAASAREEVIVLCGVRFMAETASILSPSKTVLMPEPEAGCVLADCVDTGDLARMQLEHPEALTVMYVNSPAEAKAMSYACCTSANAVEVVSAVPSEEVIFGPDRNLGTFVSRRTERTVHLWQGACDPHAGMDLEDLESARREWPDAEVLVHPETPPEAWEMASGVMGTGGMIRRVRESGAARFVIGTEAGMVHRLETLFPDRRFRAAGGIRCEDMKVTTPEKVLACLEGMTGRVELPREVSEAALKAVLRMTEMG